MAGTYVTTGFENYIAALSQAPQLSVTQSQLNAMAAAIDAAHPVYSGVAASSKPVEPVLPSTPRSISVKALETSDAIGGVPFHETILSVSFDVGSYAATTSLSDGLASINATISNAGNLPSGATLVKSIANNQAYFALFATFIDSVRASYEVTVSSTLTDIKPVTKTLKQVCNLSASDLWTATQASMPQATVGLIYGSNTVYISSGTATYTLLDAGNLPSGATINSSTSALSVLINDAGNYHCIVRAVSNELGKQRDVPITFSTQNATPDAFYVNMAGTYAAKLNVAASILLGKATKGGASTNVGVWTILNRGSLPQGATLSTAGLLTYTFKAVGDVPFVVRITGPAGEVEDRNVVIRVSDTVSPPPPVTPTTPTTPVVATTESNVTTELLVYRMATDDGHGGITPVQDNAGTVNYVTGDAIFPPEMLYQSKKWSSAKEGGTGSWTEETIKDVFANGGAISAIYKRPASVPSSKTETLAAMPIRFRLAPHTADSAVPGTVRFTIGSTVYEDLEGKIQHTVNPATGIGTPCGDINYATTEVVLTNWVTGSPAFSLQSLATYSGQFTDTEFHFRTAGSPLRPAGFQLATTALDGELLAASADLSGHLTGDAVDGTVDTNFGTVDIRYGELVLDSGLSPAEKLEPWYDADNVDGTGHIWKPRAVIPSTARYNCVVYTYLPIPAAILGLNPVRLPMDGRVPHVRLGDSAIVHHTGTLSMGTPTAGQIFNLGRTELARVWVRDAVHNRVQGGSGGQWTVNLSTGILTMAGSLDLSSFTMPLTAYHMIAHEALVTDLDIDGSVTLGRALQRNFPLGSYLSTELRTTDMRARCTVPFAQQAWTSVWSDTRIGNTITPQMAFSLYPIQVNNLGTITERWMIQFTSSTTVNIFGETLGLVGSNLSITADITLLNPYNGAPWLMIPHQIWGAGWQNGYVVRCNTIGAQYPVDVLRCLQSGTLTTASDRFSLELLGDVDT